MPATCRHFFSCSLRGSEAELDQELIIGGIENEDIEAAERIEEMLAKLPAAPQDLLIRTGRAAVISRPILPEMMDAETAPTLEIRAA